MTTKEEIIQTEREEKIMKENGFNSCIFCGKVLNDYDFEVSCRECE